MSLLNTHVPSSTAITGFVSNGEFNYMRTKAYTRPLSVLQIRTDVRNKYSKIKQDRLKDMLTPKGKYYLLYTYIIYDEMSLFYAV